MHDPFAFRAKQGLPHHPILAIGDRDRDYERLWEGAFAGGAKARSLPDRLARRAFASVSPGVRRAHSEGLRYSLRLRFATAASSPRVAGHVAEHVVVKSVLSCLSAEWLWERFSPRVLVVHRHPLNVLASWLELGFPAGRPESYSLMAVHAATRWGVEMPPLDAPRIERSAAVCALLMCSTREGLRRHPDWLEISHEGVCEDPIPRLRDLAGALGLTWTGEAESFVTESNRHGSGYATQRVASSLADKWKDRLDEQQVSAASAGLARFPSELWEPGRRTG